MPVMIQTDDECINTGAAYGGHKEDLYLLVVSGEAVLYIFSSKRTMQF